MTAVKRSWLYAILFVLVAVGAGLTLAQAGETLALGETAAGEITDDVAEVLYTFQGNAGQTVILRMTATDPGLDPFLRLTGPDGTDLATNDDALGSLNSVLGPYTLPESGIYTITATRCCPGRGPGPASTGAFELTLEEAELPSIAAGEPVTVELDEAEPVAYLSFSGNVDEPLTLMIRSEDANTSVTVEVRDPNGQFINQVWQGQGQPTVMDPLILNQGPYLFTVSLQPNMEGELAGDATVTLELNAADVAPIAVGESVSGELDDENPSDHYAFTASESALLRVVASTDAPETPVEVLVVSPSGAVITGGTTMNMGPASEVLMSEIAIDPIRIPEDGDYLLVVKRVGYGPGPLQPTRYTLELGETEAPALQLGEAVEGTVGAEPFERVYTFEGTAGQLVRFSLVSASDSYLPTVSVEGPSLPVAADAAEHAVGPSGFYLSFNSSQPGELSYVFELPLTGVYLFHVNNGSFGQASPAEGDFRLLLEEVTQ